MAVKRKSPIKEMIDQSLQELQNSGFPQDPSLEDDRQILTGPERFAKGQKHKDEVLIDLQLADISGKEGYFLKLKKEMRPDEWMLMKTIESEWRTWPDMESAVASIVKDHTKMAPQKWGSGRYRIEYACKGGMRGKGYPPVDFSINAEEEFLGNVAQVGNAVPVADATTQVTAQLEMLGRLTDIINSNKAPGLDIGQVQGQIAGAFEKGLAIKANEGNASAQMMTAMMTGLMGMMTAMATNNNRPVEKATDDALPRLLETLKTFGVLGEKVPVEKPKTTIEFLAELKLLGMDVLKKDDPMEQITKLKQLANIAGEFMGMGGQGEKPGILEKIVDMVGPAIPGMLNDIRETASNAVKVQQIAGENMRIAAQGQGRQLVSPPQQAGMGHGAVAVPSGATPENSTGNPQIVNPQIALFFNGLYDAARTNNRMFYPVIYTSLLQEAQGQVLVQGLVESTHSAKELIELLQQYGDERFKNSEFVMKSLVRYANGFIMWVRQMAVPQQTGYGEPANGNGEVSAQQASMQSSTQHTEEASFDVGCPVCHAVYGYATEQEFQNEVSKVCNENGCVGVLEALHPVTKA